MLNNLAINKGIQMATFEGQTISILATAAQIARAQNAEPIATILERSSASLIESGTDQDGSVYYTIVLEIPIKLYADIEDNRQGLEREVLERIRPILRAYPGSRISEVIITPKLAAESLSTTAPTEQDELSEKPPSFWRQGFFRLFISNTSANKISAHNLKASLANYQVAAFVAHDDIEPTTEWQAEIELALRTMHALTAITTPDFIESRWCDQKWDSHSDEETSSFLSVRTRYHTAFLESIKVFKRGVFRHQMLRIRSSKYS
jgi:TIR domain